MSNLREILKKTEVVIFDMDGVLSNTEPIYLSIEKEIVSRYGKSLTDELIERVKGSALVKAMKTIVEELNISEDPQKLAREEEQRFREYILNNSIPVVPCAEDLIELFKSLDYRLGLATSTAHDSATIILSKLNLKNHFEVIVTGDKVERAKPEPDIYLKCSKLLNIDPQSCVAVEDSLNGCKAAKAAGMKTIAVNVEEKMRKEFEKIADLVYSSNCELKEKLEEIKIKWGAH